jgi:hypothetical protein
MNNVVYVDLWNDEEKDPELLGKIQTLICEATSLLMM